MSKVTREPRISISVSIPELIALNVAVRLGFMFVRQKEMDLCEAVFQRLGVKLKRLGVTQDVIERLVKL